MSIILKGIDIPKHTEYITLKVYTDGTIERVNITSTELDKETEAIQIPKDHGRLIDESMTYIDKTIDGYFEIYAPTILEPEE